MYQSLPEYIDSPGQTLPLDKTDLIVSPYAKNGFTIKYLKELVCALNHFSRKHRHTWDFEFSIDESKLINGKLPDRCKSIKDLIYDHPIESFCYFYNAIEYRRKSNSLNSSKVHLQGPCQSAKTCTEAFIGFLFPIMERIKNKKTCVGIYQIPTPENEQMNQWIEKCCNQYYEILGFINISYKNKLYGNLQTLYSDIRKDWVHAFKASEYYKKSDKFPEHDILVFNIQKKNEELISRLLKFGNDVNNNFWSFYGRDESHFANNEKSNSAKMWFHWYEYSKIDPALTIFCSATDFSLGKNVTNSDGNLNDNIIQVFINVGPGYAGFIWFNGELYTKEKMNDIQFIDIYNVGIEISEDFEIFDFRKILHSHNGFESYVKNKRFKLFCIKNNIGDLEDFKLLYGEKLDKLCRYLLFHKKCQGGVILRLYNNNLSDDITEAMQDHAKDDYIILKLFGDNNSKGKTINDIIEEQNPTGKKCVVIVTGKGRMGSSFPKEFNCQIVFTSQYESTFVQSLRCQGYNKGYPICILDNELFKKAKTWIDSQREHFPGGKCSSVENKNRRKILVVNAGAILELDNIIKKMLAQKGIDGCYPNQGGSLETSIYLPESLLKKIELEYGVSLLRPGDVLKEEDIEISYSLNNNRIKTAFLQNKNCRGGQQIQNKDGKISILVYVDKLEPKRKLQTQPPEYVGVGFVIKDTQQTYMCKKKTTADVIRKNMK